MTKTKEDIINLLNEINQELFSFIYERQSKMTPDQAAFLLIRFGADIVYSNAETEEVASDFINEALRDGKKISLIHQKKEG